MRALPIVERELRVMSRRAGTYWGRVGAALLALLTGIGFVVESGARNPAQLGLYLFFALAWLAFLYCLLAGTRLTADCISSERREGTLGLLFLTDLKGFDIVLGKLAATSLQSFYGLLAIFPVMSLPLMMGGVSPGQLLQVAVVLCETLLLSLAVGVFVSCWCEQGRRAAAITFLLVALITLGPFLLLLTQPLNASQGPPNFTVAIASPLFAQALAATEPARGKPMQLFWPSVGLVFALALTFLGAACAALPRIWRDLPTLLPGLNPGSARTAPIAPDATAPDRAFRSRLLDINPFYWLTARDRRRPLYVLGALIVLGLLWLFANEKYRLQNDPGWAIVTSIGLHVMLKVWIAVTVVQQLGEERRSGSIELLLSTPLTIRQMVAGQFRALGRQFGWGLLAVVLADLLLLRMVLDRAGGDVDELRLVGVLHLLALGLDVPAIAILGMWRALGARHANQAAGSAFFRIVGLPCVAAVVAGIALELLQQAGRFRFQANPMQVIVGFYVACGVNNLAWAVHAWTRLNRDFREIAASRFETGRGGWLRALFGGS